LEFANREKIVDSLYPLFVKDIQNFLYHPSNLSRTNAVMAAAVTRQQTLTRPNPAFNQPPHQLTRRASDAPQRPMLSDRSLSFPTPPSSASSITNGTGDFGWPNHPLTLDINAIHPVTRSLPGTPATSPSSAVHTTGQGYGALTDSQIQRHSVNFDSSFKREPVPHLHMGYPTNSQFSSRRASSASDMGPPSSAVHSRLNTVDKDELKHEPLPESQEEGYQNDLSYGVPPGTPISGPSGQVYNTPSVVAMKGRGELPTTPTHGHSPNSGSAQPAEYTISSQSQHGRQLSYHMHGNDESNTVSPNGVGRNIFDTSSIDRDTKITSLDFKHEEGLSHELPNGHNLAHGPLPAIKAEPKDGQPASKRRRTVNQQDSLSYSLGGPSPTQSTADLSIPEGGLGRNGNIMNAPDSTSWSLPTSYTDDYTTPVLGDSSTNGRKRPPSQK